LKTPGDSSKRIIFDFPVNQADKEHWKLMKVTTAMVKELRDATGAGVLDVKKALESTDGDYDKAVEIIREKGAMSAMSRSERPAVEGVIEVYPHPGSRVGVMVELNCETDFVARNKQFQTLAHDLALHVAAMEPQYIRPEDIPQEELEPIVNEYRMRAEAEGKPPEIVEKIVQGRLAKYYEEICLLAQPFVKDDEIKVSDLLTEAVGALRENIVVRRFVRYELGEGNVIVD
jgi:elongation factor Ts